MAVDLQNKSAPTKFEGFVEEQLGKVRGRIRTLDIGASLLMLLAATLGYALARGDLAWRFEPLVPVFGAVSLLFGAWYAASALLPVAV